MTSALTNQRQVFKACLTQTEFSDDVTRKIGPLDFSAKSQTHESKNTYGKVQTF